MDDAVRGEQAYHLLSALAITRDARERVCALRLPPTFRTDAPETRRELPRFVADCPAAVHLIHDGAAALHAGERQSAVIRVGTALGVGFPPPSAVGLLRIDRSFGGKFHES